jgi:hypothetical protein
MVLKLAYPRALRLAPTPWPCRLVATR